MKQTKKRIVAYRAGNLDAFVAAFIYWKLFKSEIQQEYIAIDPFDGNFVNYLNKRGTPEFLISIGSNIVGGTDTPNEQGFYETNGVSSFTRFFSYEVNKDYPDVESFENWHFVKDTTVSLTTLMLRSLEQDGWMSTTDASFKIMHQFFQFNQSDLSPCCKDAAAIISLVCPNLLPEDFRTIDAMLFDPAAYFRRTSKRSLMDVLSENNDVQFERALRTAHTRDVGGSQVCLINSHLYAHPQASERFRHSSGVVFVFEQLPEGIRGKLFTPIGSDLDATRVFASTEKGTVLCSGTASEADYLFVDKSLFE